MMAGKKLYALRGAVRCQNDAGDMGRQVSLLYDSLLMQNNLVEDDIVSLIFSVTSDLTAANPAAVLRGAGKAGNLALFAVQEAFCEGGLPGVVRALIHCYLPEGAVPVHVYRNG
ncbi:MAG TPA: chorismate mutase, partial [Treponema sp.]|nr:chorismate mutase [Treponema sp.]